MKEISSFSFCFILSECRVLIDLWFLLKWGMQLKGVNLGGYLVLEKWITPHLFCSTNAEDEYNLHALGTRDLSIKLKSHYEEYITEKDVLFLKTQGVNALRIPVGHFLFGDFHPFPRTVEYLDNIMQLADKHTMLVILDLHTAPGSQNGWDHSGNAGTVGWHKSKENIVQTLNVLHKLAKRYYRYSNLFGIELLNEPHYNISLSVLKRFYQEGYKAVRDYSKCAVIVSDAFRPLKWTNFMVKDPYENVILDLHLYQCFAQRDKERTMPEHIEFTRKEWGKLISAVQKNRCAICGEWSLGIDPLSLKGLTSSDKADYIKRYGQAQLEVFSNLLGHFFWNYKTPGNDGWDYTYCRAKGILPTF